jgi:hypothetical protein
MTKLTITQLESVKREADLIAREALWSIRCYSPEMAKEIRNEVVRRLKKEKLK